jgi:hypothetical protein
MTLFLTALLCLAGLALLWGAAGVGGAPAAPALTSTPRPAEETPPPRGFLPLVLQLVETAVPPTTPTPGPTDTPIPAPDETRTPGTPAATVDPNVTPTQGPTDTPQPPPR